VIPSEAILIAGTGAESTRQTIRLNKEAAEAGADAVLVSPPAYYKGAMTPEVLLRHYRAVADASPVPVLVYQVPLRLSTLEFPTGLIAELSRHPNIVGIKDSRGKLDLVAELVEATGDDFQVLVGSGAILYGGLEVGAVGGIVAVGLMACAEAAEISVAYAEGRTAEAGRIQERIAPVHNGIVGGMGVPGVKAALDVLGLHGGASPKGYTSHGPIPHAGVGPFLLWGCDARSRRLHRHRRVSVGRRGEGQDRRRARRGRRHRRALSGRRQRRPHRAGEGRRVHPAPDSLRYPARGASGACSATASCWTSSGSSRSTTRWCARGIDLEGRVGVS
jgi:hypothetical protein